LFNCVTLVGYVGKDPVTKLAGGTAVSRFPLATTERRVDKNGVRQEETQWHTLVAWGRLAELADEHLHKGSKLLVEGKLTYREYEDRSGQKRNITEIIVRRLVFLDNRKREEGESEDILF